eukprot:scaffold4423_cov344-Prasinococcus_capsulatus_cf.AAC.3
MKKSQAPSWSSTAQTPCPSSVHHARPRQPGPERRSTLLLHPSAGESAPGSRLESPSVASPAPAIPTWAPRPERWIAFGTKSAGAVWGYVLILGPWAGARPPRSAALGLVSAPQLACSPYPASPPAPPAARPRIAPIEPPSATDMRHQSLESRRWQTHRP